MKTANTSLRISDLDFNSIKNNLKNYLRSQSEFQDFDFEGSGMSVLLDILAYNTHYMGYYLNMVGNEAFLDTAQIRNSVVSLAKMIGYTPRSSQGATTKINVVATPAPGSEDTTAEVITLDRYTRLIGADINGINYPFVTLYSNTSTKTNGTFNFANVVIRQGEVVSRQFEMNAENARRRFRIPSANVDTSTLIVTVQESPTNTFTTIYNVYDDITQVKGNTAAYFIEENTDSSYVVQFGDDVVGKKPKNGSVITITYLDTVGAPANSINTFSFVDRVGGKFSSNVIVASSSPTYGAADKENIEDIRFIAPYYYSTQNRAVTVDDYSTLILKDFPFVDSVAIWGGEDNDPVIYGKVFLSLKPKENYFLTNLEKETIKEQLIKTRNILTVIPEIIDPDFTYILIKGTAYYNPSATQLSSDTIKEYIKASISDYRDSDLLTFNSTFRKSKLQTFIENSEKSITGSDLRIQLQKRITLDTNFTRNYVIRTNVSLRKGDFNNNISSFPQINVNDASGVLRQVLFEEVPDIFSGINSIEVVNPGINYTSTPTVIISGDGSGAVAEATIRGSRLEKITVTSKGSNYTRASVSVVGGDGSQATAVPKLETRLGRLRTFYYKTNGEKQVINDNAGTINYETGEIVISSLRTFGSVPNDFYESNILVFNLPLENEVISPLRNRILEIDENDALAIQIDVVAET